MQTFSGIKIPFDTSAEAEFREVEHQIMTESFDTPPYPLEEKIVKSKSDISYVFADETGDRFRIQFLTATKFGKGVAKVYIGKAKGARLFVDKIDRFANPKAMISTVINFFTEHLTTAEGMVLRGFIIDLSGAAAVRSIPVLKKVIKSALVSKIKVADDTFQPQEGRKYLWITKSTLKPADVFNGPGCEGAPWLQGKEKAGDQSTDKKGDAAGVKGAKFDPMLVAQGLINSLIPLLKKYKGLELKPSLNNQLKYVSVAVNVEGQPVTHYPFGFEALKGGSYEPKKLAAELSGAIDSQMKQIADAQKKAKEESERAMNLKKDPAFYLKQQQAAIEGEINLKVKGSNFKLEFTTSGKIVKARALENGVTPVSSIEFTAPNAKEDDEEMRDFTVSQVVKMLRRSGYLKGRKSGIVLNQTVKVTNFSRYGRGFKTEGDVEYGVLSTAEETFGEVTISRNNAKHKVDWDDIVPHSGAADGGQSKTKTQTASGKVAQKNDPIVDELVDYGFKDVKQIIGNKYRATTKTGAFIFEMNPEGLKPVSVSSGDGAYTDYGPWSYDVLRALNTGAYWLGTANRDLTELGNDIVRDLQNDIVAIDREIRGMGFKTMLFKTKDHSGGKNDPLRVEREYISPEGQVFKFHMFGVWKPQDADMEVNVRFEKVGAGTFGGLQDTARVSGPTNVSRPFVRIAGDLFDGFLTELQKGQKEKVHGVSNGSGDEKSTFAHVVEDFGLTEVSDVPKMKNAVKCTSLVNGEQVVMFDDRGDVVAVTSPGTRAIEFGTPINKELFLQQLANPNEICIANVNKVGAKKYQDATVVALRKIEAKFGLKVVKKPTAVVLANGVAVTFDVAKDNKRVEIQVSANFNTKTGRVSNTFVATSGDKSKDHQFETAGAFRNLMNVKNGLDLSEFVQSLMKPNVTSGETRAIVRAQRVDRHGSPIIVSYDQASNTVNVKDVHGTNFSPANLMFSYTNIGTSEGRKMFVSGVRNADPRTSKQLASVLQEITKLSGWVAL